MPPRHPSDSEAAHPLVRLLVRRHGSGERVLVLGFGSGRNLPPLHEAGLPAEVVEPDAARRDGINGTYDAVLSTSALLHGTRREIRTLLDVATERLRPGGGLYATFGSQLDPRFGRGTHLGGDTWAAATGREAGVPHTYFDRSGLEDALGSYDAVELTEDSARETAGSWAHDADEAAPMRHWFVLARKRI